MRKSLFVIPLLLSLQSCLYKCDVFPDFSDAHVYKEVKQYSDTLYKQGGFVELIIDLVVTNTTKLTVYKSDPLRYRAICGEQVLYFAQDTIKYHTWGKPDQKTSYPLVFWIEDNDSGSERIIELQYSLYKDNAWTKWNKIMDVLQLDCYPEGWEE